MKKTVAIVLLLFLITMIIPVDKDTISTKAYAMEISFRVFSKENIIEAGKQGRITIFNYDSATKRPIKNTQYSIFDKKSNKVVQVLTTNVKGKAESKLLNSGTNYKIKQNKIMMPYEVNKKELLVNLQDANFEVRSTNHVFSYVKKYQHSANGTIEIKKVFIPVDTLLQNPQLPNGCEITSLTAVLNFYHYNVKKTKMADDFLQKKKFTWKHTKLYGPDPSKYYAGNPRNSSGFFSYAPPIVKAANSYFKNGKGKYSAKDISGSNKEVILGQLKKGIPVVVWVTLDLKKPRLNTGWYLENTKKYFRAPVNLHAVVLNGYDEKNVYVMNPLKGQVTYDQKKFFDSYIALGRHAMMVAPK